MSFAQVLSTYFTLNCLVVLSFIALRLWWFSTQRKKLTRASVHLKLHYWIISGIVLITVMHPFFPKAEIFRPAAKVWAAPSYKTFPKEYAKGQKGFFIVPSSVGPIGLRTDEVALVLGLIAAIITLIASFRIFRDIKALIVIRRQSFSIRSLGSVNILLNDNIQVPFSSWLPGRTDIVIPSALVSKFQDFKIAVAHELQHHRQGDTKWVYVIWVLKVLCAANPFVYLWSRWISEIQEFACDETLVDQKKVESQQYARCLVEVAQTANKQKYIPVCATGLVFLIERNLLKRRIERMLTMESVKSGRSINYVFGLVVASLMVGVAYASSGFIQDRRVSMEEAQRLALKVQQGTVFPIVVNDLVLKQLNRYIGTPEGRVFMRAALQRLESYRGIIEPKINGYRVPTELLAVPITESGYRNLSQSESSTQGKAAGLWQFIPETARVYGMQVDDEKDERLDVPLATDSALRYLLSNHYRFNDWHLSLLAYNMGEEAVQKGIYATGRRNAWDLIRAGFEGDKDYLPKLMAAILIMKNPETLK